MISSNSVSEKTLRFLVDRVSFSYGLHSVITELSVSIESPEFIGILGPNGSGKTTFIRLLSGYLQPVRGSVFLDDRDLHSFTANELARLIAFVGQTEHPSFPFSVFEMVMLGRHPYSAPIGFDSTEDKAFVEYILLLMDISHLKKRNVMELSGGEFHRVVVARALAQDTPFILLDEPTAHLDVRYQIELFDLLTHFRRDRQRTVLCITHDLNLAGQYCDRVLLMNQGTVVADGKPAEVLVESVIESVYGIQVDRVQNESRSVLLPLKGDHSFERFPPYRGGRDSSLA